MSSSIGPSITAATRYGVHGTGWPDTDFGIYRATTATTLCDDEDNWVIFDWAQWKAALVLHEVKAHPNIRIGGLPQAIADFNSGHDAPALAFQNGPYSLVPRSIPRGSRLSDVYRGDNPETSEATWVSLFEMHVTLDSGTLGAPQTNQFHQRPGNIVPFDASPDDFGSASPWMVDPLVHAGDQFNTLKSFQTYFNPDVAATNYSPQRFFFGVAPGAGPFQVTIHARLFPYPWLTYSQLPGGFDPHHGFDNTAIIDALS